MDWFYTVICAFGLAACAGGQTLPPLGPVTIADPISYLADPARTVRFDIGHYQATVGYRVDDRHAVTTWDYAPFGTYDPATGDGGEAYVVDGDLVRIEGTRDGGHAANQYFTGRDCGGTGWVLFRRDADASVRELVARLGNSDDPGHCAVRSSALTRYTVQSVNFPTLGQREAIVSEHWNAATLGKASAMERSFFVSGLGRVVWQAFGAYPPAVADLATRCPDFGWSTAGTLRLVDCRISTDTTGETAGTDLWRLGR